MLLQRNNNFPYVCAVKDDARRLHSELRLFPEVMLSMPYCTIAVLFLVVKLSQATFSPICPGNCTSQFVLPADTFSACRDYIDYPFCLYDEKVQNNRVVDAWEFFQERKVLYQILRSAQFRFLGRAWSEKTVQRLFSV